VEDLVETLTRGNVAEVKVLLASIAMALALYQLTMAAIGYRWVRPRVPPAGVAFNAHRAIGDALALVMLIVGVMCLSVYGFEDDHLVHAVAGSTLLAVLALKVAVVRRDFGLGRYLPVLGISVFLLLAVTWTTSAGALLAER
jgi:Family of unknown function (DUF6529)